MDETYINRVVATVFFVALIVLTYFLIQPILMSIVLGIILAFMFNPIFKLFRKKIKSKNLVAFLMCTILILVIVLPLWFLTPVFINQTVRAYIALQQVDLVGVLATLFPHFFSSEVFSHEVETIINTFIVNSTNSIVKYFANFLLNLPTLLLQLTVVLFTMFFVLRDKDEIIAYIKSILPFSKEIEKKLFSYSEAITSSVIYGQVIIGAIQGLVLGLGLFIFGVPNALILSLIAVILGILPIVGTFLVWAPLALFLFIQGESLQSLGVVIFGTLSSTIDNFLRPIFVSRMTRFHSGLVLIGMIGGLIMFGVLGLILGPLILAYFLIVLEVFRNKKTPGIFSNTVSS